MGEKVDLELIHVGSPVFLDGSIKATVTGICIRENYHVTYECSWWDKNTHNCKWLEQCEVRLHEQSEPVKIGFQNK